MTIGERIRNLRKTRNLTQKQLGELSGIAEPTIRRYELGKLNPKYETIKKIAVALQTTPEFLMGSQGNYTSEQLIDLYIHGAKVWATDFRFSEKQKTRAFEFLAETALRLKEVMNQMAEAGKVDEKIVMTPSLEKSLESISIWTANALKYVNEDYFDDC